MTSIPSSKIPSNRKPSKVYTYDLIPDGDYPARIVRFIGLGVQAQPPFQGQEKQPAFKASFAFELIGMDTSGTITENIDTADEKVTPMDPKPACVFNDCFLFPGAQRGKVFDLCEVLHPGIVRVPDELGFFEGCLNQIVSVSVGNYMVKSGPNAGKYKNTVRKVSAIPDMFKSQVGEARCQQVFFDPYQESDSMFQAYGELYPFQREILTKAFDPQNIVYLGKQPPEHVPNVQEKQQAAVDKQDATQNVSQPEKAFSDADFDEDMPF